ncbi:hypothetical protein [Pandoraea anhela]|uniref:hypothetical protein n=1 Tax=Pandoraea anhela TaxID=2508295 RepID=UPI001583F070|nr:hypothetical protein [Pandoraea anhela]
MTTPALSSGQPTLLPTGRTIVVTGAASGIGAAIARGLAVMPGAFAALLRHTLPDLQRSPSSCPALARGRSPDG